MKKPFRVLCIDGGGMRGLFVCELIKKLLEIKSIEFGRKLNDPGRAFDLIAGTSTGGIIACALGLGIKLDDIISIYKEKGRNIFPEDKLSLIKSLKTNTANAGELKISLESVFKDKTLRNLYEERDIAVCIPVTSFDYNSPEIFRTPHKNILDGDMSIVDALMATSAAPVLFSPHYFNINGEDRGFVDGGLWANNPSLVALAEAMEMAEKRAVDIISIGIYAPYNIHEDTLNRHMGVLDWTVIPMLKGRNSIINLLLDSQSNGSYQLTKSMVNLFNKTRKNKIRLIRWPLEQLISEQDKKYMDIDSAGEIPSKVMRRHALNQAQKIINEININKDMEFLDNIFIEM